MRTMSTLWILCLVSLLWTSGCSEAVIPTESDGDADGDADGNADGNADGDADGDGQCPVLPLPSEPGDTFGMCASHADCTVGHNGRCVFHVMMDMYACSYDECYSDDDCQGDGDRAGQCMCSEDGHRCELSLALDDVRPRRVAHCDEEVERSTALDRDLDEDGIDDVPVSRYDLLFAPPAEIEELEDLVMYKPLLELDGMNLGSNLVEELFDTLLLEALEGVESSCLVPCDEAESCLSAECILPSGEHLELDHEQEDTLTRDFVAQRLVLSPGDTASGRSIVLERTTDSSCPNYEECEESHILSWSISWSGLELDCLPAEMSITCSAHLERLSSMEVYFRCESTGVSVEASHLGRTVEHDLTIDDTHLQINDLDGTTEAVLDGDCLGEIDEHTWEITAPCEGGE